MIQDDGASPDISLGDKTPIDEALLQLAKIVTSSHNSRELRIRLVHRVESLEFDAGIRYAELPIHCADSLVAMLDSGQKENDNLFKVGALTKEMRTSKWAKRIASATGDSEP